MSILMLLVGAWVLVNAINGNLPGLVNGTIKFNTPGTNVAPTSTGSTGTTNNPSVPVVNNSGAVILRPGAPS